jgi:diacylglycerol O-acyltransferase / wax synthase
MAGGEPAAGKAAGGSLNDAFLAGILGAFRRYHEHFGLSPALTLAGQRVRTRRPS